MYPHSSLPPVRACSPFPVTGGASQNKLIRDAKGLWYLLGFRSDPDDDPHGTDYVDVYEVAFSPRSVSRTGCAVCTSRSGPAIPGSPAQERIM